MIFDAWLKFKVHIAEILDGFRDFRVLRCQAKCTFCIPYMCIEELEKIRSFDASIGDISVSYTHLTLPTNREV